MRRFKAGTVVVSTLQLLVTWFLFETVPNAGSGLLMTWQGSKPEFSLLTHVALGLLRVAAPDPHARPITTWWSCIAWGVVLAAPVLTALATLRASDIEDAQRRFSLGSWAWVSSLLGLGSVVAMGCAQAFACL